MKQALSKSDISQMKEIDLNRVFGLLKSGTNFPEKNKNSIITRNTLALILQYAKKYKIDIQNILTIHDFVSNIESQTQDFYDLGIAHEIKKILKASDIDESEKLYAHILHVLEQEKSDILSSYIRAIDNSAIVQIIDRNGIIKYVNDMYKQISWDNRNIIGRKISAMWGKLYHDNMFWKNLWETILRWDIWQGTIQNPRMDDKNDSYYTYTTITPVKNDFWEIIEFITIKFDITKSKKFQHELWILNEELNEIINSTSQWFWIIDKDLYLLEVNESLCKMLGYPKSEMIGRNIKDFLDERNQAILDEQVKDIETTLDRKYHLDFTKKNGSALPVILKATSLYDKKTGNFKKAIAFITDITEIREDQKRLYDVAMKDDLTWIWNKRHFNQNFDNYFGHIINGSWKIINMSICLLDIDFFKHINDSLWHDVGDIVLKEFGKRLLHISKKNIEVYRVGGEEFWVIWYNITPENFITIMEDFRKYNEEHPVVYSGWEVTFTISGWISHFKASMHHIKNPRSLFKETDKLLYKAKWQGRNNIQIHDDIKK